MDKEILWKNCLDYIATKTNSITFTTWFNDIKIHSIKNNKIILIAENQMGKERLNNVYKNVIIEAINKNSSINYDFEALLQEEIPTDIPEVVEIIEETNNKIVDNVEYKYETNISKNLTFENFVIGDSNKFAARAALAVAENTSFGLESSLPYNPLYIYGNSGLGKTHLMHAIGNFILENNPECKVLYVRSDMFIEDFIKMCKAKDNEITSYYRNKYRNVDVLLIDDIQNLQTAQGTQVEFFNTFNYLKQNNKTMIFASDRSPNDLKEMEDRIKTRFSWGMTVTINPPDFELRKQILLRKLKAYGTLNPEEFLTEEALDYIACNFNTDVRNLEGAINKILFYSTLENKNKITLNDAIEALKDLINKGTSEVTNIQRILKFVADAYQINADDIKSKKRTANISYARFISMYLSRDILNEPYEKIGLELGGRDHSTVMHGCEKIEKDLQTNTELKSLIQNIKAKLMN